MPYCLTCGRSFKRLENGVCPQCALDADVSGKHHRTIGGKRREVTPEWIISAASRYRTQMAHAFRIAAERALGK